MKIVMDFIENEFNNVIELHCTRIESNEDGGAVLIGFEITPGRYIQRRVLVERYEYKLLQCYFDGDDSTRHALKGGLFDEALRQCDAADDTKRDEPIATYTCPTCNSVVAIHPSDVTRMIQTIKTAVGEAVVAITGYWDKIPKKTQKELLERIGKKEG